MRPPWIPDTELQPELAERLIRDQFPQFAPVELSLIGEGWDYWAYRVNEEYVFRFPRRRVSADLVEREWRILPLLAPQLPLPVPVPRLLGRPALGYPYPFLGQVFLPGTEGCRRAWTDRVRSVAAPLLARFLTRLHGIPVDEETRAWAPSDEIGRSDLGKRAQMARERLARLRPRLGPGVAARTAALIDRLGQTPPYLGQGVWVHGDLYACQILFDDDGRPAGVLDWVDVHLGDPALDLALAYGFLPPAGRQRFRRAYRGHVDPWAWDRARFRALQYGLTLLEYGDLRGDEGIRAAGEYSLQAALAE